MAKKNPYLNDRDILDQALEHSWGKTADAKAKEKAYNREYYQRHKEEILRKARQAGEGIQRTAQNAYNTARREAQGIRDAVNPQPRQYSNPKGWTGGRDNTLWGMDKYVDGAYKERINEARKNRNLAKNTPGAAETERRYRNAMRERSQTGAAVNEALKNGRQLAPDSRFDSKLVRDAQNAYSKLRNPKEMARRAGESAKKAYDDVKTAFSNERRQTSNPMDRNTIRPYERAHEMNDRLLGDAKQRFKNAENRVQESNARAERFRKASDAEGRKHDSEVERSKALRADPRTRQLAVDARTEADAHLDKAAEYQKMAKEAGQETYNRLNESNRAYKNQRRMANRRMNSGTAYNEASKAAQRDDWGLYDKRFDSKLARNAQITYSKARGTAKQARDSVDQFVNNALSKTKKKKKS